MSLPDGVTTCLVTYGPITNTLGTLAESISVAIVADRTIVHGASGRTLFKNTETFTAEAGGTVQIPVPHVDQAGFRDQQQNALTNWYYTVTLTAKFPNGGQEIDRKVFQPLAGQVTVDADLLPSDGLVTPGVTAPTAVVTSVNGETGAVTVVDEPPAGASMVYATDDPAVADAYPQYAWVILAPPDTTAPTVPTNLTATPGDTQVVLDWTDSTDAVGVTGYKVYRGGVLIASPTVSTYTDTGRTNGVLYSYTVSAVDEAGNESAQTTAATATPASPLVVIASDDFNRANMTDAQGDTATGLGTTPVGSKAWNKTGMRAQIVSNQVRIVSSSGSTWTYATVDSGVANHDVSAKFYIGHAGDKGVVHARYVDDSNLLRLIIFTTGWTLHNVTTGTSVDVVGFTGRTVTAGDTWRLRIVGNTYTVFHNGTQISTGSVTTASTTATKCGLGAQGTNFAMLADDFSVSSA